MQRMEALPLWQAQDALAGRVHNDGLCERGISCGRTPHAARTTYGNVRITARYVHGPPSAP
jgi:hypothetical protein